MNKMFLVEKDITDDLFPFTLTKNVADLRIGILTIREKWQLLSGKEVEVLEGDVPAEALEHSIPSNRLPVSDKIIRYPWHIFTYNDSSIREDFSLLTKNRKTEPIPDTVRVTNSSNIFIEKGARVSHCILNAEAGPIYIGKNAEIMEGSTLRGPVAVCEHAVVKMGARIYGATTVGPYSIVGGEIKNAVIMGYSNKAHDGYLGDSVIGEWCNLGAGTSNSNMKNNVSEVRVWNEMEKRMIGTGLTKCGLVMGDYSRAAINTSFNTGTVVGVCANVFGEGSVDKYVPSFAWGVGGEKYELEKAFNDIAKWKKLKGQMLTEKEKTRLKLIFGELNKTDVHAKTNSRR